MLKINYEFTNANISLSFTNNFTLQKVGNKLHREIYFLKMQMNPSGKYDKNPSNLIGASSLESSRV